MDQLNRFSDQGLDYPEKKEIARKLISSAENSTLNWKSQYEYIEDIQDGRGYTAGIIGFTSAHDDMLRIVLEYTKKVQDNPLAKYISALKAVNGTSSHQGLDPGFPGAWKNAAADLLFRLEQDRERDNTYFDPAVKLAKMDGLHTLGQFIYYDAAVVHGFEGLEAIRKVALRNAGSPNAGAGETAYLNSFLDERVKVMKSEPAHSDVSRIEDMQRLFLKNGNLNLQTPLKWKVYEKDFQID